MGYEEQNEWYFFSYKDRKYPTGTRTNRATAAGFWKATGRDKTVFAKDKIIGMRKTLVYYKGRAPNGAKTDWIMHEYRLETSQNAPIQVIIIINVPYITSCFFRALELRRICKIWKKVIGSMLFKELTFFKKGKHEIIGTDPIRKTRKGIYFEV